MNYSRREGPEIGAGRARAHEDWASELFVGCHATGEQQQRYKGLGHPHLS